MMKATFSTETKALDCIFPSLEPVVKTGQYARALNAQEIAILAEGGPFIDSPTGLVKVPAPSPVRELSKLTLRRRLRALGAEDAFDDALDAIPNARADWDDAQNLRTDDPLFTDAAAFLIVALDLTEEEFAALIAP